MTTITITEEQLESVIAWLAERDVYDADEISVRTDYSGRAMYGRTCVGFVAPNALIPLVTIALFHVVAEQEGDADALELIGRAATDSMGMSTIVYFPSLQVRSED